MGNRILAFNDVYIGNKSLTLDDLER